MSEEGSGFEPEGVYKGVRDAGFTAVDLEITAVGPVSQRGDLLILSLPHQPKRLVLVRGERFGELVAAVPEAEREVRVRGLLHPSHGDDPPSLTVEWWEDAGDEPQRE